MSKRPRADDGVDETADHKTQVQRLSAELKSVRRELDEAVKERDDLAEERSDLAETNDALKAECDEKRGRMADMTTRMTALEAQARVVKATEECPYYLDVLMPTSYESKPANYDFRKHLEDNKVHGDGTFPHTVIETKAEDDAPTHRVYIVDKRCKVSIEFFLRHRDGGAIASTEDLFAWAKLPNTNALPFQLDVLHHASRDDDEKLVNREHQKGCKGALFKDASFDVIKPEDVSDGQAVQFTFRPTFLSGGLSHCSTQQFRLRARCTHPFFQPWLPVLSKTTIPFAVVSKLEVKKDAS